MVVDASVAAKWLLPEPGSDAATALRMQDNDLIAPALVLAELGSAFWKSAMRGDLAGQDIVQMLRTAAGHYNRLIAVEAISAQAMALAIELRHPIYDCFYLALAERERAPLISADKRLLAAAKRAKGIEIRTL
jgi:predicted nucleic acid-binding protein